MEIEVAVPSPIIGTFTYKSEGPVPPGIRVLVPFGRQKLVGVTVESPKVKKSKLNYDLKSIAQVIDEQPVFSPELLELGSWMAGYYQHPIGEVFRAMLPASTVKSTKEAFTRVDPPPSDRLPHPWEERILSLFGKRRTLSRAVLVKKIRDLEPPLESFSEPGLPPRGADDLLAETTRRGFLAHIKSRDIRSRASRHGIGLNNEDITEILDHADAQTPHITLTSCQQRAMDCIEAAKNQRLSGEHPKPVLVFGITGSGKTEVYLRSIARILHDKKSSVGPMPQVLVMVPEISLTPQMTHVFLRRFPDQVAVVHSAMPEEERWEQLERIRRGEATVLIGPRSTVFAPFRNLQLIIVDEEHDPSYKQATGLRYNGRDVAIKRAHLEKALVLLGSATPSLESYTNGMRGRYSVVELVERPSGRALPQIACIQSAPGHSRGTIIRGQSAGDDAAPGWPGDIAPAHIPIASEILDALKQQQSEGMQSIVLVNRRGYAYFLFSVERQESVRCPHCSISLTLHKKSAALHCHYCDHRLPLGQLFRDFPGQHFVAVGYGSETTEEALRVLIPGARIERLDSDVASNRDHLADTLAKFRNREIDILVGTQILAKGHDFPGVTLVVILEVDQILNLPDFRAGERTYQLIVQAAGRAGRAEHPGRVLVQCARPQHPIVASACMQDYSTFANYEIRFRQAHGYPPFRRIIAFDFSSSERSEIDHVSSQVEQWRASFDRTVPELSHKVRLLGPATPPLERVRGRNRLVVLFTSEELPALRTVSQAFLSSFQKLKGDLRLSVDVDPQSLL